jgi:hypothetical protein
LLGYTPTDGFSELQLPIVFLPTGEIDLNLTSATDLATANEILAPTINFLRVETGLDDFNIWPIINWVFVSYYWLALADLGQIAPIYYDDTISGLPNFTSILKLPSTNNIFTNVTLFGVYSDLLRDLIFPFVVAASGLPITLPEFLPLDGNNTLQLGSTSLSRSYSCQKRQAKWWGTAVISVIAAEYAIIVGGYSIFIWLGKLYQEGKDKNG